MFCVCAFSTTENNLSQSLDNILTGMVSSCSTAKEKILVTASDRSSLQNSEFPLLNFEFFFSMAIVLCLTSNTFKYYSLRVPRQRCVV